MAAIAPTVQAQDGFRVDAPGVAVPEHEDRAEHTRLVLYVKDVGPAVPEEDSVFSILLPLHKGEHLRESGFGFCFAAEFGDDRTVHR